MLLVEAKKKWNLMVFESIAKEFDRKTADHRGDKGACAAAACLWFLTADPKDRQRFVDVVKLAEGRGLQGSVLDAALRAVKDPESPQTRTGLADVIGPDQEPPAKPEADENTKRLDRPLPLPKGKKQQTPHV